MPFGRTYTDGLDPEANARQATEALASTRFGPVTWVAETGSTNDDLMIEAIAGAPDGCVLVADHQTAGRGRRDRKWASVPRTALQMSVLLRPHIDPGRVGALTAALGVAAADACGRLGFEGIRLKWPNDLVIGEVGARRKLAGMLTQVKIVGSDVAVVAGLGLNVHSVPPGAPQDTAACLADLGPAPSRVDLVVELLSGLDDRLDDVETEPEALWDRYRDLSATLGTRVLAQLDDHVVVGDAVNISDTGSLIVDTGSGVTTEIVAADVVSLRPGR